MTNELPKNIEYLISAYALGGLIIITYLTATYIKLKKISRKLKNSPTPRTSEEN